MDGICRDVGTGSQQFDCIVESMDGCLFGEVIYVLQVDEHPTTDAHHVNYSTIQHSGRAELRFEWLPYERWPPSVGCRTLSR